MTPRRELSILSGSRLIIDPEDITGSCTPSRPAPRAITSLSPKAEAGIVDIHRRIEGARELGSLASSSARVSEETPTEI